MEGRGPIEKQQLLDVWGRKKRTGTSGGGHLKTSKGWKRLGEWGGREGHVPLFMLTLE